MIDRAAIFDAWLRQSPSTFATFMGTQGGAIPVSCPVAPASFDNSYKAIVFHPDGEAADINGSTIRSSFTCKCYGGSNAYEDARAVAGALYDHCHNKRGWGFASAKICKMIVLDQFQGGEEPDLGWPVQIVRIEMIWEVM